MFFVDYPLYFHHKVKTYLTILSPVMPQYRVLFLIDNCGPAHVPLVDRSNRWSFHRTDTLQQVVNPWLYLYPVPNWSVPQTIPKLVFHYLKQFNRRRGKWNPVESETDFPTNLIPASLLWFVVSFSGQSKVVDHNFVFQPIKNVIVHGSKNLLESHIWIEFELET